MQDPSTENQTLNKDAIADILESIAVVRLEVSGWSGNLAGSGVRMSDLFTLLKMPSGWKIIQKAFHWYA